MNNSMLWLILIPLLAAPVIYLAGRLTRETSKGLAGWLGFAALVATWIPFVGAAQLFVNNPTQVQEFQYGALALRLDGLSLLLAAVALGLGTLVMLYSGPYMGGETGSEKYYALLSANVGVMIGLGCATDLFNLWVWFEAMAVSSYLLIAFYRDQPASLEAGVKYLVQSAVGSSLVLVAIALVLLETGTTSLAGIYQSVQAAGTIPVALYGAVALFVIGFGVKAALVPMHTWLPDAHAQAPSGISAMLSGVVIEAGLIALLRVLGTLVDVTPAWGILLLLFAALNMLVGNLLALRQTVVKRLLAFSSLAHVGYMLLGLGITVYVAQHPALLATVGGTDAAAAGAQGAFFHLITHGMMKGLAFLAAGSLLYTLYIATGRHGALTIKDLAGGSERYPIAALALSIAVLGLGGLPPLAGFMSKWQILVAGAATKDTLIIGMIAFAALNSLLSLAYYAPIVNTLYKQQPSAAMVNGAPMSALMTIPLVVLALAVVVVGVYPQVFEWLTKPASLALLPELAKGVTQWVP